MSKYPELAFKMVNGTQATTALVAKLVQESAFFQVTPLPGDDYEIAVKIDRQSLLSDQVDTRLRTYEDADFTTMNMAGLVSWYVKNVGYDPVADYPNTDLEELRARCTEMLQIDRENGSDWFVVPEFAETANQQSHSLEPPTNLADNTSMLASEDAGMNSSQHQHPALDALHHLANDIGMLASGDWVPDDDSCEASLDNVECARLFVSGSLETLLAAKKVVLDIEEGACPKASAKLLKDMMVSIGVWNVQTKNLGDE